MSPLNPSTLNPKASCPLHSVDGRNPELRGGQAGRCLVAPGSRPLSLSLLAICHPHPLLPTHSLSLFSHTLSLKPSSLNPQPQTPKPRPLTPNLKPQTLKSQPETLNNKQQTSNNQKVTINDKIPHETFETLKPAHLNPRSSHKPWNPTPSYICCCAQVQDPEVAYQLAETLDKALSVAELIIRVPQPSTHTSKAFRAPSIHTSKAFQVPSTHTSKAFQAPSIHTSKAFQAPSTHGTHHPSAATCPHYRGSSLTRNCSPP